MRTNVLSTHLLLLPGLLVAGLLPLNLQPAPSTNHEETVRKQGRLQFLQEYLAAYGYEYSIRSLRNLKTLRLRGPAIPPTGLKRLEWLPSLRRIHLEGPDYSDIHVRVISDFPGLRELSLEGVCRGNPTFTNASLQYLAKRFELRTLTIECTAITDEGLSYLQNMKELWSLSLISSRIRGSGFVHLRSTRLDNLFIYDQALNEDAMQALSLVQTLYAIHLRGVEFPGCSLKQLRKLPELERLSLEDTRLSNSEIECLGEVVGLRRLRLGPGFTGEGLRALRGMEQLEELSLSFTDFRGPGLDALVGLKRLKRLDLAQTRITEVDIQEAARISSLEELQLDYTEIGDEALQYLEGHPNLKILHLPEGGFLTENGVKSLAKIPALHTIWLDLQDVQNNLDSLAKIKSLRILQIRNTVNKEQKKLIHTRLPYVEVY